MKKRKKRRASERRLALVLALLCLILAAAVATSLILNPPARKLPSVMDLRARAYRADLQGDLRTKVLDGLNSNEQSPTFLRAVDLLLDEKNGGPEATLEFLQTSREQILRDIDHAVLQFDTWRDWRAPARPLLLEAALHQQNENNPATLQALSTALQAVPKWMELRLELGTLLTHNGRWSEAGKLAQDGLAQMPRVRSNPTRLLLATLAAQTHMLAGDFAQAQTLIKETVATSETHHGLHHPLTLQLYAASRMIEINTNPFAPKSSVQALVNTTVETLGAEHPFALAAKARLATALFQRGDFARTERLLQQTLPAVERALGHESSVHRNLLLIQIMLRYAKAEYPTPQPMLRDIEELAERTHAHHPLMIPQLINLTTLLTDRDDFDTAKPLVHKALAEAERIHGRQHRATQSLVGHLAYLHFIQQDYDTAEPLAREAYTTTEQTLDPNHIETLLHLNLLARLLVAQGNDAAAPLIDSGLKHSSDDYGPNHPATLHFQELSALMLNAEGHTDEAERLLRRCLATWEKTQGPDHPLTLATAGHLAQLLLQQEKYSAAEALFERTHQAQRRFLGTDHPATRETANHLATCRAKIYPKGSTHE